MIVYQIALPIMSNDGLTEYSHNLHEWEQIALDEVGGYTDLGIRHGVWRDVGRTYSENMQGYQLAIDSDRPFALGRLIDAAKRLFPDQVAFYLAKVGTAEIIYNNQVAVA
jgi:hypothetical protein